MAGSTAGAVLPHFVYSIINAARIGPYAFLINCEL